MRYETIKQPKDTDFKRRAGVHRETFEIILNVIKKGWRDFGRPTKLNRANQLLMTLMYWREYEQNSILHNLMALARRLSVGPIQNVENALVRSGRFRPPGKKVLQPSDHFFEVVLVDVSEQPIERPKNTVGC